MTPLGLEKLKDFGSNLKRKVMNQVKWVNQGDRHESQIQVDVFYVGYLVSFRGWDSNVI